MVTINELADAHRTIERLTAERDGAVATSTCVQRQHTAAQRRRDVLQGERDAAAGECDQLRAQVTRLRSAIDVNVGTQDISDGTIARRFPHWAADVLEETPAQSVAHIEVAALRRMADAFYDMGAEPHIYGQNMTFDEIGTFTERGADRIEQAAGA